MWSTFRPQRFEECLNSSHPMASSSPTHDNNSPHPPGAITTVSSELPAACIAITTDMSLLSPLHTPVPNALVSSDSALTAAVPPSQFLSPNRQWLPQIVYDPTSKWKSATGRSPKNPEITFDYIGHSQQGVSMREIHNGSGNSSRLNGLDDAVLHHTGLQKITLKIIVRTTSIKIRATNSDCHDSVVAWL